MIMSLEYEKTVISVPVLIDARRTIEGVRVVRTIYLVITAETPIPGGLVVFGQQPYLSVPILGQMGIIYRPNIESLTFQNQQHIDNLFVTLETELNYSVELEDIWIPESWFPDSQTIIRGNLFRLAFPLFEKCYRFREGTINHISDLVDTELRPQDIQYSDIETAVFQKWNQRQIQEAIETYPKYEALALKYDESRSYE